MTGETTVAVWMHQAPSGPPSSSSSQPGTRAVLRQLLRDPGRATCRASVPPQCHPSATCPSTQWVLPSTSTRRRTPTARTTHWSRICPIGSSGPGPMPVGAGVGTGRRSRTRCTSPGRVPSIPRPARRCLPRCGQSRSRSPDCSSWRPRSDLPPIKRICCLPISDRDGAPDAVRLHPWTAEGSMGIEIAQAIYGYRTGCTPLVTAPVDPDATFLMADATADGRPDLWEIGTSGQTVVVTVHTHASGFSERLRPDRRRSSPFSGRSSWQETTTWTVPPTSYVVEDGALEIWAGPTWTTPHRHGHTACRLERRRAPRSRRLRPRRRTRPLRSRCFGTTRHAHWC